jgi:hypothetical protein
MVIDATGRQVRAPGTVATLVILTNRRALGKKKPPSLIGFLAVQKKAFSFCKK